MDATQQAPAVRASLDPIVLAERVRQVRAGTAN
jgi:hypothetical protein